ncbi:MAG: hypothetical protein U9N30_07640 [Campylobacterota bacterium]|nr:hypothetical protein [Campylobacterota bacterium]
MKKSKFMMYAVTASLLFGNIPLGACGGGGGDGGGGDGDGIGSFWDGDFDLGSIGYGSVGSSDIAGSTVEIEEEPLTLEELEKQRIKQEQFWSGLENKFWTGVSGLMAAGEFGSKVVVFGSGVALASMTAAGTVVITSGGVVVGTISAGTSLAIGTTYTVVTSLASGNSVKDTSKAGLQTLAVSVLLPAGTSSLAGGFVDTTLGEIRGAMPDVKPSTTKRTPTYSNHSPNYNGTRTTNSGHTVYH